MSRVTRRAFIQHGSLVLLAAGGVGSALGQTTRAAAVEIGLLTDLHYADKEPLGNRCYRDTLEKAKNAIAYFNQQKLPLAVMLGDFVDGASGAVAKEIEYLKTIEAVYAGFTGERHYVLGNHCVAKLTKEQFREHTRSRATYYSFDHAGFHFVVLDACFNLEGIDYGKAKWKWQESEVPPAQRDWLRHDLRKSGKPTVVFIHQRLDEKKDHCVNSRADVRKILEDSGKVLAVFQGHSHGNDVQEINGIPYVTVRAMVERCGEENNAYAVLSVYANGDLKLEGFRQQKSYDWAAKAP